MQPLEALLIAEISSSGPMPFETFLERALYDDEHGFYVTTGRAGGRTGDFITSVEVGPLFAAVISSWLDRVWDSCGQPGDFRVAEAGAGVGTLYRGINRAQPACWSSLTYTLVERSAPMREAHDGLPTTTWRSSAGLPAQHQHVVLANELLDNLAFGIAERVEGGWAPVLVDVAEKRLGLRTGHANQDLAALATLAPVVSTGSRVPVATQARSWIDEARTLADHVVVFDYGATTAELAERGQSGWLRTYANHARGSDPLARVGSCDITCDVAFDQLPEPTQQWSQAAWLDENGIERRVERARKVWSERAHVGDLTAVAARSALGEAEALTDETGLGAFRVLEWRN